MIKSIEYSIVIRTLGTAGLKYQALLDSISSQSIQPKELIVVIPHGYELPKEQLGIERFIRSDKGMVVQRTVGLEAMNTEFGLFLDDDLSFNPFFVQTLIEELTKYDADIVFPILEELLPSNFKQKFLSAVTFSAIPFKSSIWFTKIYRNGSYGYNKDLTDGHVYDAMTASGACFFCKKRSFMDIHFADERWLEKTIYALPEDQVMFYKFYLLNKKIKGLTTCKYIHLDAGGNSNDRKKIATYAMSKNKFIFWHRFIYKTDSSIISRAFSALCFSVTLFIKEFLFIFLSVVQLWPFMLTRESIRGIIDGYKFIKSQEYKEIPLLLSSFEG
jgi:glycosyltransferase involved in cell wall biosynthesis